MSDGLKFWAMVNLGIAIEKVLPGPTYSWWFFVVIAAVLFSVGLILQAQRPTA